MIFIKSIFGGLAIAIASCIYLAVGGGVIGALLFSIGLLLILNMKWKLFTSTVGFINNEQDVIDNIFILIGNVLGACGSLAFAPASASSLVLQKLAANPLTAIGKGIICGMFIYCAVILFNQHKDYMVITCVMGFILCGAEHCIADLCYVLMARAFNAEAAFFLLLVTLGNIIGATITRTVALKNDII